MKVKLNKWQLEVAKDPHRFQVICAGRRSGKSVLARLSLLKWAVTNVGYYYLVSPTRIQAKSIHWEEMRKEIPKEWIVKTNETELSFTLRNGSVISLQSAENPDSLRGVKLRGLVIDECASMRNWNWLWGEVLRPTLTDYESPVIFISTPKGYNHFYDLFQSGLQSGSDYKSWRFTSYDNPYIPKDEIEKAKKELSEDTFAQEYMADFRKATGLAIKLWDRERNLIKPFVVPQEWQRGRGFDYGSSDPTASVRLAIDNEDNWFVERCYKDKGQTIQFHAQSIMGQDYGLSYVPIYGDPSGDQWEKEFQHYGVTIQPANKEVGQGMRGWVEYGIEMINQRLKPIPGHTVRLPDGTEIKDAPKMFVLDTTENSMLTSEIEHLAWRETAQGTTIPVLDEGLDPHGHSDLTAALRYFAVSYKRNKETNPYIERDMGVRDWSIA
jgi:hypothetical protein